MMAVGEAAGLRRRRVGGLEGEEETGAAETLALSRPNNNQPQELNNNILPPTRTAGTNTARTTSSSSTRAMTISRVSSRLYGILTAVGAFLAIVTTAGKGAPQQQLVSPSTSTGAAVQRILDQSQSSQLAAAVAPSASFSTGRSSSVLLPSSTLSLEQQLETMGPSSTTAAENSISKVHSSLSSLNQQQHTMSSSEAAFLDSLTWIRESLGITDATSATTTKSQQQLNNNRLPPPWLRWLPFVEKEHDEAKPQVPKLSSYAASLALLTSWLTPVVDPTLLHPSATTLTDLIDKILTSTPRLLAIANMLLALTFVVHAAVANYFLGTSHNSTGSMQSVTPSFAAGTGGGVTGATTTPATTTAGSNSSQREQQQRLGGFLVFKLLLISAVVSPDTLDLLILLSWYTLLSFLRSLAQLCAATTTRQQAALSAMASPSFAAASSQPRPGVLQLLLVVLLCDFVAAAGCVALFHAAGWNMVLLLTCDCALLAVDVVGHIVQHIGHVLEGMHAEQVHELEQEQQARFMNSMMIIQQQPPSAGTDTGTATGTATGTDGAGAGDTSVQEDDANPADEENDVFYEIDDEDLANSTSTTAVASAADAAARTQELDHRMEVLEQQQLRRLAILDTVVFIMSLVTHVLTVCHFGHIWSLHGIQFTLIDGVLALHLHSALSTASRLLCQRRNLHRIARDLDGMFEQASELELRKAAAAGDVCCICLATMTTVGNVKKVACGHLYHTNCLREVVERARSMEAARCPLCRASVTNGQHQQHLATTGRRTATTVAPQQQPVDADAGALAATATAATRNNTNNNVAGPARIERALFRFSSEDLLPSWIPIPAFSFEVVRRATAAETAEAENNNAINAGGGDQPQHQHRQRESIFRRLLILSGAISMSQEEEAVALDQLVDMFPQYDRSDLLRELRARRSSEAVAEAILAGAFGAVVRGRGQQQPPAPPQQPIVPNDGVDENEQPDG